MNDLELIQRCAADDSQAKNELVTNFSRLIYHSIHAVYRARGLDCPTDLISDIHNDVFLALLKDDCRSLTRFQGLNGCSLASYIRTISVNKARDYMRKESRRGIVRQSEPDTGQESLLDRLPDSSSTQQAYASDLKDHIHTLLSGLNEDERNLFVWAYLEDKPSREIAALLSITEEYVNVRRMRVKAKLIKIADEANLGQELQEYLDGK
ncbi:MAG: RNA polymerase sigma factor [Candidatus Omnitrophica bacterium]|nr:RNA polymerase sigma factor [Candidatus Omnitrophota bacterium]